jgi:4-aminobutyrate aminotransferase / (S)-3-amino-2-methylpropionate transaminase
MGDAARVILSNAIIGEIFRKKLVEQTARVGAILYAEIEKLASRYPELIQNLRGKGQGQGLSFSQHGF